MKKPYHVHFRTGSFLICAILTTACVIIACNKQATKAPPLTAEQVTSFDPSIQRAQLFLRTSTLQNERKQLFQNRITFQNSHRTAIVSRIPAVTKLLNWNDAFKVRLNRTEYLFISFSEERTPFKNKTFEFVRYLVFTLSKNNILSMDVLELLGDQNTSLGKDVKTVAINAVKNKIEETAAPIGQLNASVIFYNQDYAWQNSFHITNGTWKKERISFRSDLEINLKDNQ
jgi:hypothetical protein